MNRRLTGALIILAALIIIVGIIYVVFFYNFSSPVEEDNINIDNLGIEAPQNVLPSQIAPQKPIPKKAMTSFDLARMAASFAERFGSYSNHSSYDNIIDLKIFMTPKMQAWADNFVAQAKAKKEPTSIYYGITTKAISPDVKRFDSDNGVAQVIVRTQRRESTGTMSNAATIYQDIIINFIKIRGSWKVDSANWQD